MCFCIRVVFLYSLWPGGLGETGWTYLENTLVNEVVFPTSWFSAEVDWSFRCEMNLFILLSLTLTMYMFMVTSFNFVPIHRWTEHLFRFTVKITKWCKCNFFSAQEIIVFSLTTASVTAYCKHDNLPTVIFSWHSKIQTQMGSRFLVCCRKSIRLTNC